MENNDIVNNPSQRLVAEHLRLAYKELHWAAKNIAQLYELMKPEDKPHLTDLNQLKLFDEDERTGI